MSSENDKLIKDWGELEQEILSSKELTLHVLLEMFGGADGLWMEIMESQIGDDMEEAVENGYLADTYDCARSSVDSYLNEIIEKEVLGGIPKDNELGI
jgi:hypothetical protein